MTHTKIMHVSYTSKNGYVWRKRIKGDVISISLQTRNSTEARQRSLHMSLRYHELDKVALPLEMMKHALKSFRDEMIRNMHINSLSIAVNAIENPSVNIQTVEPKAIVSTEHDLDNVKAEWVKESKRDWSATTETQNIFKIDRFIKWAKAKGINTVEAITKATISEYKEHLDSIYTAPQTKVSNLAQVKSYLSFCVNQRDYISKNPVDGLSYKNAKTVNKKISVTHEEYQQVLAYPAKYYKEDSSTEWAIKILHHTGMRINELCQITKSDYIIEDGIKCFSLNTNDGKSLKNESSIRNIPIADKLLEMGIWEEKPTIKYKTRNQSQKIEKIFAKLNLKRTCHCFRYGVSDRLRDAKVESYIRAFILGHTPEMITDRVYINKKPLKLMQEAINLIA